MSKPRLETLDGLRGIAILLVFATHALALPLNPAGRFDAYVKAVAHAGWMGVDLFFVLSGFLITGIILDTRGRPHWWRNFFARRVLRIFPLYFGALAVVLALTRLLHASSPALRLLWDNQIWYWTYTVNILGALTHGRGTPPYGGHPWSLSIEEQFYLVWPFVAGRFPPRRVLGFTAGAILGGLCFRIWLVSINPIPNANAAYLATPGRLDGLMVGAALALIARRSGGLRLLDPLVKPVLIVATIILVWIGLWRGGFEHPYEEPIMAIVSYPLIALVWGALLLLVLRAPPMSRLARVLGGPVLGRLGRYSYGIYLVHLPLVGVLVSHVGWFGPNAPLVGGCRTPVILLLAVGVAGCSYGIAAVSHLYYERRFLDLKRYFSTEREQDVAPRGMATL